jgi:colanic acid biosynthesis glycosyl transferase WcaI
LREILLPDGVTKTGSPMFEVLQRVWSKEGKRWISCAAVFSREKNQDGHLRILIVSQYFWPESFRINDLAAGLVERGHQVSVLTGIPNYPGGRFFPGYGLLSNLRQNYRGVRIMRIPLIPRGKGHGIQLVLNYVSFAFLASALAPILCGRNMDLIFVCQLSPVTVALPALVLKKLRKVPLLMWILDLWPESLAATGMVRSRKVLALAERLVRFIYHGCDRILVASRGFVPSLYAKGVREGQIEYFPNWFEPEYCILPEQRAETGRTRLPEGFRVMFAGNIGVAQDFENILIAVEKLKAHPDIHLIVIGDGRRFEWVKGEVQRRGLHGQVHLLGWYPPSEMAYLFAQADVMLVTLKKDPMFAMTIPGKIQSYMACGRPIVAALDGEGASLINESGAGLVVGSEDPESLSRAILTMYKMPRSDREAMGRRGRDYCESSFEREMLLDRLNRWAEEMVATDTRQFSQ